MRVPQGAYVEGHRGAEAGQDRQPEVERGRGPRWHRGGQLAQADPRGRSGWGGQLPDGARLHRGPVAVLLRVQGPDAPSDVQGEGVGRFEVGLPGGLGGGGAQQLLRVLEVGRVGDFPLAEGALPKGGIGVDGHRWRMGVISRSCCCPADGDAAESSLRCLPLGVIRSNNLHSEPSRGSLFN